MKLKAVYIIIIISFNTVNECIVVTALEQYDKCSFSNEYRYDKCSSIQDQSKLTFVEPFSYRPTTHPICKTEFRKSTSKIEYRYLLYDVNPGEGFNLRRDVYLRLAVMVKNMNKSEHWKLVLPPWDHMYHWKSNNIGIQQKLPWSLFFDLESFKKYVQVIELDEFLVESGSTVIDKVYYLQHFPFDTWKEEYYGKYEEVSCNFDEMSYYTRRNGMFYSWFWGYDEISANKLTCLAIQGHAKTLGNFLQQTKHKIVMIDRSEVILHDNFGDIEYWMARRCMKFSKHLLRIANKFSQKELHNYSQLENDSLHERPLASNKGGPYVCGHIRRGDFIQGTKSSVPSTKGIYQQLEKVLIDLGLKTIFLATDADEKEISELTHLLGNYNVVKYKPPLGVLKTYKDGGVAIIDQIICSHARYFIGTHRSTFSFRIQEEREIMGLPSKTTFNRFCGDHEVPCEKPSVWKFVHQSQFQLCQ